MKVFGVIMKIVIALAAVAGAVYLAATYGDKLVAWAKKLLGCKCCSGDACCCDEDCCCDDADISVEVTPADEITAEESDAEVPAAQESAAVASEADFEG